MYNAAAITAVHRALANYRRRQTHSPTDHSAREIVQMSMLAEYLHENHTKDEERRSVQPQSACAHELAIVPAAA